MHHGILLSAGARGARARASADAHGDGHAAARVDGIDVHYCGRRQRPRRVAGHAGRAARRRVGAQAAVDAGEVELRSVDARGLRGAQAAALLRLAKQLPHALRSKATMLGILEDVLSKSITCARRGSGLLQKTALLRLSQAASRRPA